MKRLKWILSIGMAVCLWHLTEISALSATDGLIPDSRIVLVAIDDNALNVIGPFPWERSVYAKLLTSLNQLQTETVGLYIHFTAPSIVPKADALLQATLKRQAGKTVICSMLDYSIFVTDQLGKPVKGITLSIFDQVPHGYCNLPEMNTRLIPIAKSKFLAKPEPAFAFALLKKLAPARYAQLTQSNQAFEYHMHGGPGAYQQVSAGLLRDALSPKGRERFIKATGVSPEAFFRGKIVLLGATASGLDDPVRTQRGEYSKLEIQAHILDSLLHG